MTLPRRGPSVAVLDGRRMSIAGGRRGPALGGACLGICDVLSETRGSVPIAARQSVRDMPVIDVALKRIKR